MLPRGVCVCQSCSSHHCRFPFFVFFLLRLPHVGARGRLVGRSFVDTPKQLNSQLGALSKALLADPDLARTGLTRAAAQSHRLQIVQRLTRARPELFPAIPVSFISDVSVGHCVFSCSRICIVCPVTRCSMFVFIIIILSHSTAIDSLCANSHANKHAHFAQNYCLAPT